MTTAQDLLRPLLQSEGASFASYSNSIYLQAYQTSRRPEFGADFNQLEELARLKLTPEAYDYGKGGAGMETTVKANREAFNHWFIIPRMLREVTPKRILSRTIFGRSLPAPIVMAPIGVQDLFHADGERATAKVFGELGLPFTLSTASSTGMATVASVNGSDNPRWYQLYWPTLDDQLTASYLNTAKQNGYDVLVVTVDTWELAWRSRDLTTGFFPFIKRHGTQIGLEDEYAHSKLGFDASLSSSSVEQKETASLYHVISTSQGISPTWKDLAKLRQMWGSGPIVLKGIQSVEDAKLAVEYGMNGIIVSNHGGRQVDGAIGSLDALVDIVDTVKGQITIGFDSGIRCGADIFKALAIGADFVQLGRPILWGLAQGGENGVRHVLKSFLADFDLTVGLSGHQSLDELDRSCLRQRNT